MPTLRISGSVARACFGLAVIASLVILFLPGPDVPPSPAGVDKLVHASLFAVLAFTARWAGLGPRVSVPLVVGYAAASELVQAFAPIARDGSWGDLLADCVGVLLASLAWVAVARARRPNG